MESQKKFSIFENDEIYFEEWITLNMQFYVSGSLFLFCLMIDAIILIQSGSHLNYKQ